MSPDELNTFLNEFMRALFNPTAPLPSLWPVGALGVFLIFATQIGAGIPLGVIMARNAGLSFAETAALYLASDVVLAVTTEPTLILLRWLGKRVEFIGRLGARLARFSGAAGLQSRGVMGPLGLILFSFTWAPAPARAASQAAGHGFVSGWTLAIIGDMAYFGVVMASTLWISSVFGDDRWTIGAVLIGMWLLPLIIRRLRSARAARVRVAAPARVAALSVSAPAAARVARKATLSHNGRRRRSGRGAHR